MTTGAAVVVVVVVVVLMVAVMWLLGTQSNLKQHRQPKDLLSPAGHLLPPHTPCPAGFEP
jgi:hypothetical protein